jgi:hypothetical protein
MDDSTPDIPTNQTAPDRSQSLDWLLYGFFTLILALSALVALLILIAYRNGT